MTRGARYLQNCKCCLDLICYLTLTCKIATKTGEVLHNKNCACQSVTSSYVGISMMLIKENKISYIYFDVLKLIEYVLLCSYVSNLFSDYLGNYSGIR